MPNISELRKTKLRVMRKRSSREVSENLLHQAIFGEIYDSRDAVPDDKTAVKITRGKNAGKYYARRKRQVRVKTKKETKKKLNEQENSGKEYKELLQALFGRDKLGGEKIKEAEINALGAKKAKYKHPFGVTEKRDYDVQYALVDLGELETSHKPSENFAISGKFPQAIQDRDYTKRAEKDKVIEIASKIEPEFMLSEAISAGEGTPIITKDGIVLSGNARTMGLALAAKQFPESWNKYKNSLQKNAIRFGFLPSDVQKYKNPVLVRMTNIDSKSKEAVDFGIAANAKIGAERSEIREAASFARNMPDNILNQIRGADDTTIGKILEQREIKNFLIKNIPVKDQQKFINQQTGRITESGKALVKRIMLIKALKDVDMLEKLTPSQYRTFEGALPSFVDIKQRISEGNIDTKKYPIMKELAGAVNFYQENVLGKGYRNYQDYIEQGELYETKKKPTKEQEELIKKIEKWTGKPRQFRNYISNLASKLEQESSLSSGLLKIKPEKFDDIIRKTESSPIDTEKQLAGAVFSQPLPSKKEENIVSGGGKLKSDKEKIINFLSNNMKTDNQIKNFLQWLIENKTGDIDSDLEKYKKIMADEVKSATFDETAKETELDIIELLDEIIARLPENKRAMFQKYCLAAMLEGEDEYQAIRTALGILAEESGQAFFKEVKVEGYTKSDGTKVKAHTRDIDAKTVEKPEQKKMPGKIKELAKRVNKKTLGAMTRSLEKEGYSPKQAKAIVLVSMNVGWPIPAPGATIGTAAAGFIAAKLGKKVVNKVKNHIARKKELPEGEWDKPSKPWDKMNIFEKLWAKLWNRYNDTERMRKAEKVMEKASKEYGSRERELLEKRQKEGLYDPYQPEAAKMTESVSACIRKLRHEGYPQEQAVAIALSKKRKKKINIRRKANRRKPAKMQEETFEQMIQPGIKKSESLNRDSSKHEKKRKILVKSRLKNKNQIGCVVSTHNGK